MLLPVIKTSGAVYHNDRAITEEGLVLVLNTAKKDDKPEQADQVPMSLGEAANLLVKHKDWILILKNIRTLLANRTATDKAFAEMETAVARSGRKTKEELDPMDKSVISPAGRTLLVKFINCARLASAVLQIAHRLTKSLELQAKGDKGAEFDAKFLDKDTPVGDILKAYNKSTRLLDAMYKDHDFFINFGNDTHNRMIESVGRISSGNDGHLAHFNSIASIVEELAQSKVQKYAADGDESIVLTIGNKKKSIDSMQDLMETVVQVFYDYARVSQEILDKSFIEVYTGKDAK